MRVWWPDDGAFYEARIKAWDRERDVHTLLYILDGVEVRLFIFIYFVWWAIGVTDVVFFYSHRRSSI